MAWKTSRENVSPSKQAAFDTAGEEVARTNTGGGTALCFPGCDYFTKFYRKAGPAGFWVLVVVPLALVLLLLMYSLRKCKNRRRRRRRVSANSCSCLAGSLRMSRRTEKRFLTESDEYQCPLSADTQKIAEDELRETDNSRSQALTALRSWLQQNPKFSAIRMDSSFLLRFLRAKKFSVPMAQEAIERYILLRQSWGIAFNQLDYKLPVMLELLELGYIFVSPFKDKLGRRVVIYRPGVFDPYKYTNQDMCRIMGMCYETLLEDEENQVRGVVHYADGSGVSFPHLTLFTPKEAVRIVKNGERTLPMRHKEIYGVNVHPTVKFALDFGMALISEKIKKRVKLYSAPEDVEIDKSLLPKEYGGTMPMKEMISLWIEELASKRDIVLLNDKMAVRLEMYSEAAREGAISALKAGAYTCAGADAVGDAMRGLTGNFRKLEVD